jgi:hypothetical protein
MCVCSVALFPICLFCLFWEMVPSYTRANDYLYMVGVVVIIGDNEHHLRTDDNDVMKANNRI